MTYIPQFEAGDIVFVRKDKVRRYEVRYVGETSYFLRGLFTSVTEPEECCWDFRGMDKDCVLEWSKGPDLVAKEATRLRDTVQRWRKVYYSLTSALDHHKEGESIKSLHRIKLVLQQWKQGDVDDVSALVHIFDEVVMGKAIPVMDEDHQVLGDNQDD